jgi:hypothetical protein
VASRLLRIMVAMVVMIAVVAMRNLARLCRLLHRHSHDLAVAHAPLGDDVFAEVLDVIRFASQYSDLQAGVLVEMDVQRCER